MNDKKKSRSAAPKTKRVSGTKKSDEPVEKPTTKTRKAGAKSTAAVVKTRPGKDKAVAAPAAKRASKTNKTISKTKEPVAKTRARKIQAGAGIEIGTSVIVEPVLDQTGDVSSGESMMHLGEAEPAAQVGMPELDETSDTAEFTAAEGEASAGEAADGVNLDGAERKTSRESRPPANLERLQKILSQAGIASRRHAEEMIVAGRVMVNGQVVTTLGSKADPARDHIRVDGKLLKGAERHRYFVLNKPKGYVTTVSDPEGRATVMEFFARMPERLYPVGRLDYQSEGLLLMTNDGELANLLTKAGSGVEKTYLVKVAGQPTEEELERLRGGVAIDRDEAGSERVRTAPARVRQVREGDNPWYEVVLIEGRNRELRKMFSAVGHFVEKIRRVGYGPLVLDVEPGKLRELTPEEVNALRLTAEGKLKPKRMKVERIPPAKAGRAPEKQTKTRGASEDRPRWQRDDQPKKPGWRPRRPEYRGRESGEGRSGERRSSEFRGGAKGGFDKRHGEQFGARPEQFRVKPGFDRPHGGRPFPNAKPGFARPAFEAKPNYEAKPRFARPASKPPRFGGQSGPKPGAERPFRGERPPFQTGPRFARPGFPARPQGEQSKPRFERRAFVGRPRPEGAEPRFDAVKRRPFRAAGERPSFQRAEAPSRRLEKPPARTSGARPEKAWTGRPRTGAFGAESKKQFASGGRFEARGGAKSSGFPRPGGFSKAGGKGANYKGKFGGSTRGGFRPPGKPVSG
jgi:23S rRNA pseudouridine2605 synthase